MTNSILKASGADNGTSLDHVKLIKSCLNTIILLNHVSAEFTRKTKGNLRNTIHSDFLAPCTPKLGTTTAKVKPKNQRSTFLSGDNLKQAAQDARRSQELTKKNSNEIFFRLWQERWLKLQSTSTIAETTFLQQQLQKQRQPEPISFHRELPQLKVRMLNKQLFLQGKQTCICLANLQRFINFTKNYHCQLA